MVRQADDITYPTAWRITFKDDVQENLEKIVQLDKYFQTQEKLKSNWSYYVDDESDSDNARDEAKDKDLSIKIRNQKNTSCDYW